MITSIELDLYFTLIYSSANFNKINASLQKLLSGNENCDNDTADADAATDDADGQHDPYVSVMLRRRHDLSATTPPHPALIERYD